MLFSDNDPNFAAAKATALNWRPTPEEEETYSHIQRQFSVLQTYRAVFGSHWEEIAELIDPQSRNTFFFGTFNWQGLKKTDRQVDATGMVALQRFGAIVDSLITPRNMMWHQLTAEIPELRKNRDVRLYLEDVTRRLFRQRYSPIANFSAQNQAHYKSLGAYGTASMFIDQAVDPSGIPIRAIRYRAVPVGEMFLLQNHQGLIIGFVRWLRMTAYQAWDQFGSRLPAPFYTALEQNSETLYDFLHCVWPRKDYDPRRLDAKGKKFVSYYVSLAGNKILSESGYNALPISTSRYDQAPQEVYGRSPAMLVLPALKTINAEKRTFLKQGHRAADPVLLVNDDGIIDMSLRPGAINVGGVSSDGKPLVHVLPTGEIQVTKEMMDEEKMLINDVFLVNLFQVLTENPQMTATEVIERTNEKGILIAPTIGRQQSEYLGPLIDRELGLMAELGLLPPMPPALREAAGGYDVVYTSPLSRAQRAQDVAGFQRTMETAIQIVNVTQDPSILDVFDMDTALPEISEINGMPVSWLADDETVAKKRQARAQAQARQEQIQAAPAAAATMKAAVAAKQAGGAPGG